MITLEEMYRSTLQLSAHFRVMNEDWLTGPRCLGRRVSRVRASVAMRYAKISTYTAILLFSALCLPFRHSSYFMHMMCYLMAPVLPPYAPYPSSRMNAYIYAPAMETIVYNYNECTWRMARDCNVYSYAEAVLSLLIETMRRSRRAIEP